MRNQKPPFEITNQMIDYVAEIAELVGYENEYYFIRAFKSFTGKTPGKYTRI